MDNDSTLFPVIPTSTIRAARAHYGQGNLYLRLGDRLNHLASKIDTGTNSTYLRREKTALLAVLIIIQYVEKLTDADLTESIQQRMELRYALHLPTPSYRIDPHSLCEFRRKVLTVPEYHALFKEVFKNIYPEITSTTMNEEPDIDDVLHSMCVNEVDAALVEAMFRSMEALSAAHFNWLREIALPHWYHRYSHSLITSPSWSTFQGQDQAWDEVRADVQYLLHEIHKSDLRTIMEMPEIKNLSLVSANLTDLKSIKGCDHCINRMHFMKGGSD